MAVAVVVATVAGDLAAAASGPGPSEPDLAR